MTVNAVLQTDTVIIRNNEPLQADVDGEIVMASLEQGNYYGLGSVGSRIWELLEQPTTKGELISRLCDEYEVDQETCEMDTQKFLTDLLEHNLLTING